MHTLVLATTNAGKVRELASLLAGIPGVHVVMPKDLLGYSPDVVEDGETFEANAALKAKAVAALTHCLTLADDSGLEVDALFGAPGVRSARFAHERATDSENNAALLAKLGAMTAPDRDEALTARFRCAIAIVDPFGGGEVHTVDGDCEGEMVPHPRGASGFGYDPLFQVAGTGQTFAELNDAEKHAISHRGKAMAKARLVLEKLLLAREERLRKLEVHE